MSFEKDNTFISGRLKSVKYAVKGMFKLLTTEHSIMTQIFIAMVMIVAGFYFEISRTEWILQTLTIGVVLGVEGMNTAIEKICDFIHPGYHERIGFIKDISAGAVMLVAISAIAIGMMIYVPKFL
ncbi:MAG: diacylglycerol kinase family protein [Flavobacterium sp.]|nr:diacylglycerol kinase family protein [Flavobacterium sp.]